MMMEYAEVETKEELPVSWQTVLCGMLDTVSDLNLNWTQLTSQLCRYVAGHVYSLSGAIPTRVRFEKYADIKRTS